MAKLFIKQKVFSWKDDLSVFDENQEIKYRALGRAISLGKKLTIYNSNQEIIGFIGQRLLNFTNTFDIYFGANAVMAETDMNSVTPDCQLKQRISFFKRKYDITEKNPQAKQRYDLPWLIEGNYLAHEYDIKDNGGNVIAKVTKAWLTWGDFYEINFDRKDFEEMIITLIIGVDAALAMDEATSTV